MSRLPGNDRAAPGGSSGLPPIAPRLVRFGVFELDLSTQEIRRNGLRVVVHPQPFEVLSRLLERPGEVVTRDELRRDLWADTVHVDSDHCLNTVVHELRELLNDSADSPRFIETVPKRGYRFVAPVSYPPESVPAVSANRVNGEAPSAVQAQSAVRTFRRSGMRFVGALGLVLVCTAASFLLRGRKTKKEVTFELSARAGSEVTPALSVDGQQAVFAWNEGEGEDFNLYTQAVHGNTATRLTSSPSADFGPAYSPDGKQIAFYRRSGDRASLYLIQAAGGPARRLAGLETGPPGPVTAMTGGPADLPLQSISWSPDGASLAFVDRPSLSAPFSVFAWSLESAQRMQLTWPPASCLGDGSPAFSPAGDKLAFVRWQDASAGDIYVVSPSGGNPLQLTSDAKRIRGLTWTPDGRFIVFSSHRDSQPSLWRVPAAGGAPERFSGVAGAAVYPAMARRDSTLVYMLWSTRRALLRIPIGAGSESVTPARLAGQVSENEEPRYSPDGRRVAFSSDRSGRHEIWVADASGANPVQLTTLGERTGSPRWSPDGRQIAFDSRHNGNWDIYVIDAAGGVPRRVAAHAAEDSRPSWSADGRWIYFGSDRSGSQQVWKVAGAGGAPLQVTRNGGYEAFESSDGRVLYYTRSGVPGLWSVPIAGGEEQLVWKELPENSRNWTPAAEGIYHLAPRPAGAAPGLVLQFFRISSQRVEQVADLPSIRARESGLSASPDGRWLIFSGIHEMETDLAVLRY